MPKETRPINFLAAREPRVGSLRNEAPCGERLLQSLTVHVESPEFSEATRSPFSKHVTRVSGTFRTTWGAACVLLSRLPPQDHG